MPMYMGFQETFHFLLSGLNDTLLYLLLCFEFLESVVLILAIHGLSSHYNCL